MPIPCIGIHTKPILDCRYCTKDLFEWGLMYLLGPALYKVGDVCILSHSVSWKNQGLWNWNVKIGGCKINQICQI